MKIIKNENH